MEDFNNQIQETFKIIKMERRRKVTQLLKLLALIAVIFTVYMKYFNISNWGLALLYSFLTMLAFGFILFTVSVYKYVQKEKQKD